MITVTLISESHTPDLGRRRAAPKPDMSMLSDPEGRVEKQAQGWQIAFMFIFEQLQSFFYWTSLNILKNRSLHNIQLS